MATKPAVKPTPNRTQMNVLLGKAEKPMGRLIFVKDGQREFSQFAYSDEWLSDAQFFDVSPDLIRQSGYQLRKPPTKTDTCFFLALADTEPDAWGRRVIARAHAKARAKDASLGPLTEADYLACVDDFSRVGALRLRDEKGHYLRSVADGARAGAGEGPQGSVRRIGRIQARRQPAPGRARPGAGGSGQGQCGHRRAGC
jgi:serine/threonine-protein kinase HipA